MTDWKPTAKQSLVLQAASEQGLRRSITTVCDEAGVTRAAFYKWLGDPGFAAAWEDVWHGTVRKHLPGVVAAMVERAQSGDVAAARLIADMAGVIKQKHELTGKDGAELVLRYVNDWRSEPET